MDKYKITIFSITGLVVLTSALTFYYWNKSQNQLSNSQTKESISRPTEKVSAQSLTAPVNQKDQTVQVDMNNPTNNDEQIKKDFQATEIISNNLPEAIEFWTEAYCPGSGTNYDYVFSEKNNYGYSISSCVKGETGSHGGCKTCVMSKLKLTKSSGCENNKKEYHKIDGINLFIETLFSLEKNENCNHGKTRTYGPEISQSFDAGLNGPAFIDYNFDGIDDISFLNSTAQNDSCSIYLYDPKIKKFLYNEELSSFNCPSVNQNKKEVTSYSKMGAGDWDISTYKFINSKLGLINLVSCHGYYCQTHYKYDVSGKGRLIVDDGNKDILINAVMTNDIDFIKKVIAAGADINLKNYEGKTALDIATENNLLEVVKVLKDSGAKE